MGISLWGPSGIFGLPALVTSLVLAQASVAAEPQPSDRAGQRLQHLEHLDDDWAAEVYGAIGFDNPGWADTRAFFVVEPGLFLEGRRRWLSAAFSSSVALDVTHPAPGGRWPPVLHAGLRIGFDLGGVRLRLGPTFDGNDRGEWGYRTELVPIGNADLRWQPRRWTRTHVFVEAGGHGTHATIAGGLHLGIGRVRDSGGETRLSAYVSPLMGIAARHFIPASNGGTWILAGQIGADVVPRALHLGKGGFEVAVAIGRRFDAGESRPDPNRGSVDCTQAITVALAGVWRRHYAFEYERHLAVTRRFSLVVGPGWSDRLAKSIRLSGPVVQVGTRIYFQPDTLSGGWAGLDVVAVDWTRASGWQSANGTLGLHTDTSRLGMQTGASLGYAWIAHGIRLSTSAGASVRLRGYDLGSGQRLDGARIGFSPRLNLGAAF